MGTISEWVRVLAAGALWGGLIAWRDASKDPLKKSGRGWVLFALDQMAAGLLFGILLVFEWRRAFHQPVVYITAAAVAGMFVSGLFVRSEKQKSAKREEQNLLAGPADLR
jgi:hypothetical protein